MKSVHYDETKEDEEIVDFREKFHTTVRENIIYFIFFLSLSVMSWVIVSLFWKKKDRDVKLYPVTYKIQDDDESLVYRICFGICVFSLSISIGATLLLPISIVSNEVLLIYPRTYYIQWLNETLIQGLWNWIFLFANLSIFILLPFAHLFIESEGFSGYRKGLAAKFYEASVMLVLAGFAVCGMTYILESVLTPEKTSFRSLILFIFGGDQLPFVYSCVSFFGVLLLLVCTPVGVSTLFTYLNGLITGPQFLRNLEEEYQKAEIELYLAQKKLAELKDLAVKYDMSAKGARRRYKPKEDSIDVCIEYEYFGMDQDEDPIEYFEQKSKSFKEKYRNMISILPNSSRLTDVDSQALDSAITTLEEEIDVLEKLRKVPGWKRNLFYPLEFLLALVLTALAVFMVIINTLQLVVGLKSLPFNTQNFSLGLSSISMLGSLGAALEVILVVYLLMTSVTGLYTIPLFRHIAPKPGESPIPHIIYNCSLILILSSALPVLARILGITNFDLLGNYGKIEWLGNFYVVLCYNIIFSVTSTVCLMKKVTSAIRRELFKRLKSFFQIRYLSTMDTPCSPSKEKVTMNAEKGGNGNASCSSDYFIAEKECG